MEYELIFRIFAAVAAVVVVAPPLLVAVRSALKKWVLTQGSVISETEDKSGIGEMRIVLELANTLKARGNQQGVALCKQLLDAMLQTTPPPQPTPTTKT